MNVISCRNNVSLVGTCVNLVTEVLLRMKEWEISYPIMLIVNEYYLFYDSWLCGYAVLLIN